MKKLALRERARRLEEKVLADTERAKASAGGGGGDNPLESLEKGVIRCKVWNTPVAANTSRLTPTGVRLRDELRGAGAGAPGGQQAHRQDEQGEAPQHPSPPPLQFTSGRGQSFRGRARGRGRSSRGGYQVIPLVMHH